MEDTATPLTVDGLKMEPESYSDGDLTPPSGGVAKHAGLSFMVPAVKCEAELDVHVVKAESGLDHDMWPASPVNEDMEMEEKPVVFAFVAVNGEEELRDIATVKQEVDVELATEEQQVCFGNVDCQETGSEIVITDPRQEKHSDKSDTGAVTEVKRHVCHLCGKQFHRRRNLLIHKRIHTREKSFSCDVCKKEFTSKGSLRTHFLIHTGEKPFRCELCGKEFLKNGDLVRHRRVHTGEKPYACDICSKTFSQRCSLTYHVRIHKGEKPFKCEVCGKEFLNSCDVVIHCRAHTGEKPYKCDVCLKAFSRWAVLVKHKRSHSRNKDETTTD